MRVLHVCAELYPLLKTGGLADVAAALPPALCALGCDVRVLLPGFPAMLQGIPHLRQVAELPSPFTASPVRLYAGRLPHADIDAYLIDAPDLYDRPGNPYVDAANQPYRDNDRRFALLGWMGARLAGGLDAYWKPVILHGHDWHAGLMPAYLRIMGPSFPTAQAKTVFTIHNLAYQGTFAADVLPSLALPSEFFSIDGLEFHGQVSFMKAGIFFSDKLTTVSPTYAREIQDPAYGCGLHGLLRHRANDLHGVLNGVDPDVWNPETDRHIAAPFQRGAMLGKRECKRALQAESRLAQRDDALLFGVVSRLTEQKGLNLVLAGLRRLVEQGGQLVLLGSGDPVLERAFRDASAHYPDSVAIRVGYDDEFSHRVIAGSDVILVPSLFEPCGLTQLYGLLYGTLPLVRRVGGLADTVSDCTLENLDDVSATGFVFDAFHEQDFNAAVRRAFALHRRPDAWKRVQDTAMQQEFSWQSAAQHTLDLYRNLQPDQ